MRPNAAYWIKKLQLTRHVEGGSYREVYRSALSVSRKCLPVFFQGDRNISTAIYFLLQHGQFSAFHRIASDELWHFYFGDPLLIHEINHSGILTTHRLGNNPENGEVFQILIRAGSWFASVPAEDSVYALAGCTVSPGFDFADFELAERNLLCAQYPMHSALISRLSAGG
jgi:predicted cupin superfamily sugar epimerase